MMEPLSYGISRSSLDLALSSELDDLASKGLLRKLRRSSKVVNSQVEVDGVQLISFASNNYLGLAGDTNVRLAVDDVLHWGSGSTGSRLTSGNFDLHERLERQIAAFKHTEAAIVFSSGYAANTGTIPALVDGRDLVLSDALNHASLIDGCRLSKAKIVIYRHNDTEHVRELLEHRGIYRRFLLVTDGVFSMDGDIPDLTELAEICDEYDGWLMVDDAHGTGVYGKSGAGVVERFNLGNRVAIQMGTLSKAIGSAGGFVAGSNTLIELLRNRARSFMFSTASAPADIAAASKAIEIILTEPERRNRLRDNIRRLRQGLGRMKVNLVPGDSPIIAVLIGDPDKTVEMSKALEACGFWVPAIRPPTVPDGTSRLRITVSAAHTNNQIDGLLEALASALK